MALLRIVIITFIMLGITGCGDPMAIIPGGKLSGTESSPPESWDDVPDTIYLEARPQDPYSITIWAVGIGEDIYVATGADGTRWSEMIDENPEVRLKVGNGLHALRATKVTDEGERGRVETHYINKYDVDPTDNFISDGIIYRFDRRSAP